MIQLEQVSKRFGDRQALSDVTLHVPEGMVFGLVGPTGCGKTTCLNIMATLLPPDSGRVRIQDLDVMTHQHALRRQIGYVPTFFGLTRGMTVQRYLDFYAGCAGIDRDRRPERIQEVLEQVDLTEVSDHGVGGLPRGQKQRLSLARACLHEPTLILLDEPASGLDPKTHSRMHTVLHNLALQGVTIVITSRTLSEVDVLCSHVAIFDDGRLIKAGSMDDILQAARPKKAWCLDLAGDPGQFIADLAQLEYVDDVALHGSLVTFNVDQLLLHEQQIPGDALPPGIMDLVSRCALAVRSATEEDSEEEDTFADLASQLMR